MSVLSFGSFLTNVRLSIVNRVVVNTPKELFLSSIPYVQEVDNIRIYFDQTKLRKNLNEYFDKNLGKYCQSYEYTLNFYEKDNQSYCVDNYCTSVELVFCASLTENNKFERTMYYYIVEMREYGY